MKRIALKVQATVRPLLHILIERPPVTMIFLVRRKSYIHPGSVWKIDNNRLCNLILNVLNTRWR